MNELAIIRWTLPLADAHILTASGNPYGNPPDVGRYLRYAFGERGLQELLQRGTEVELKNIHILLCAKVLDGSLVKVSNEMMVLFSFSAMKIAEKLSELTNQNWLALEPKPQEEAIA